MKYRLFSHVIVCVTCALAWIAFESMKPAGNPNQPLTSHDEDSFRQRRIAWLNRCLTFAETIEDSEIRFREIDSLSRQIAEIDRESIVELGPELQVERVIESGDKRPGSSAQPDPQSPIDHRTTDWGPRKPKRKSRLRGVSRPTSRRLS